MIRSESPVDLQPHQRYAVGKRAANTARRFPAGGCGADPQVIPAGKYRRDVVTPADHPGPGD